MRTSGEFVGRKRTGSAAFGSQTNQKALLLWRLGRQMTRIPEEPWQVASGKWQVANGKWQVASGKWQVASGKWQNDISVISKEWLPA